MRASNVTHAVALAFYFGLFTADGFGQRTTLSDAG
jgi:hypothetical protein